VAYEIYRGPKNRYGKIPGVFGRSEFGIEIVLAIAYQVYVEGPEDEYRRLCNELMRLLLAGQHPAGSETRPGRRPIASQRPIPARSRASRAGWIRSLAKARIFVDVASPEHL
jgi:hypothetical protein